MSDEQKYTSIEVVKKIVDTLKPKIEFDIKEMKKAEGSTTSSWLGGSQTSGQSGTTTQTTPSSQSTAGTKKPSIASQINFGGKFSKDEMPDHKTASAKHFVDMIMSKKYKVQEVMKMVPKDKRDEVLSMIRKKGGKKTYKDGLKKQQMEKTCGYDHSKKK